MAYCVEADLKDELSEENMIALTDDQSIDEVDHAIVTNAISWSEDICDSWLGKVYDVPFTTPPDIVKEACKTIAIYKLFLRRRSVPDDILDAYEKTLAWLKAVARKDATLGIVPEPAQNAEQEMSEFGGEDRVFTKDSMAGW